MPDTLITALNIFLWMNIILMAFSFLILIVYIIYAIVYNLVQR